MLKTAALAAALALPLAAPALAATVHVDAATHSSNLGTGLATGILVNPGDTLSIHADPRDTWSLGAETPCTRISDANGLTDCYGSYTQGGFTALYGTLVGRIGTGAFFVVGTMFEETVTETGYLFLYAWDSDDGDNSGSIQVTISAVPLPAGGLMLAGALGGLILLRRRPSRA
jgi:hypothetical protein